MGLTKRKTMYKRKRET